MPKSARKKTVRDAVLLAKGMEASTLRRRRNVLFRRFGVPEVILGGSLSQTYRRCGKAGCHCADGVGHPTWTLTYSIDGEKHVQAVPASSVGELERLADVGRRYKQAVVEMLAINAQLVTLWCQQRKKPKAAATSRRVPKKKRRSDRR